MKERLLEFLRNENKSSAQLAEEIGVQPSGISHILSGRNNPSLDFVLKMLEKYPFLSTDWLLFGKGNIYKDQKFQNLFNELQITNQDNDLKQAESGNIKAVTENEFLNKMPEIITDKASDDEMPKVLRIVWFYENNSFKEFFPDR